MGMVLTMKCQKIVSVCVCMLDQYKQIIFKFFQRTINCYVTLTLSTILGLAP